MSILILLILILMSGYFSGIETAFTSLSIVQIQQLKHSHPSRGRLIEHLVARPDRLLTTILIGNNLVNVAAAALATQAAIDLFGTAGVGVVTGVLTLVILIFGEVTPKQLAITYNVEVCLHSARIIFGLAVLLRPFVVVISAFASMIARLTGRHRGHGLTLDGVLHLVKHAESLGVIEAYKSRMVRRVFRFSEVTVSAIMTHRTDVFSLDVNLTVGEVFSDVLNRGFARVPVYDAHPEAIVGIVLFKDLTQRMSADEDDTPLRSITVDPIIVPENRSISDTLAQLRRAQINMAIVLDEYGGLAGIVTTEDIIEEIVGELYDEDEKPKRDRVVKNGEAYVVVADMTLHDFNDYFRLGITATRDIQTVAGYLTDQAGRIPSPGESITTPVGTFVVKSTSKNRIVTVSYTPDNSMEAS